MRWAKCFTYIILFNPHNDPIKWMLLSLFINEETGVQVYHILVWAPAVSKWWGWEEPRADVGAHAIGRSVVLPMVWFNWIVLFKQLSGFHRHY